MKLIATRTVVAELDREKDSNPRQPLRDRARAALKRIEAWAGSPEETSSHVTGEYYKGSPSSHGLARHGLHGERNDDLLIATVLQYRQEYPNAEVVIVTNDTGPRLAAVHFDIRTLEVPEKYQIRTLDPLEAENRRLRADVQRLQNALPECKLVFSQHPDRHITFRVAAEESLDRVAIASRMTDIRSGLPLLPVPTEMQSPDLVPASEFERYNKQLGDYFTEMEEYLYAQWEMRQADRRTVVLPFEISNVGGAPATDIDVVLRFEAKGVLRDFDPRGSFGRPPRRPREPMSILQLALESRPFTPMDAVFNTAFIHDPPYMPQPNVSKPRIVSDEERHSVDWTVGRIKHGNSIPLGAFYLTFSRNAHVGSFSVNWKIGVGNHPAAFTGELHVACALEDS